MFLFLLTTSSTVQALVDNGHPPVELEDVKDEVFDMVRPVNPEFITFDDVVSSNVGETVLSILIDMQAFYQYDNRESLMAQQSNEEHA